LDLLTDIPENHGLSSKALLEFLSQVEFLNLEVNSFVLLQNGRATAQFWRNPYRRDCQQVLFSLSKSFTSIAVGIAWDEGVLDLQDKVISFFPDKLPESISLNLGKMTIHHLLSMNTGHHDNIYGSVVKEKDWVKAFLSLEVMHEPGSHYLYNTHATYMLSAIIQQATGLDLVDFLMPRLFQPLGIPRPSWETCPKGIIAGGMGLNLTTQSIAKFGQLLLNKGTYNGRRIVSEQYINLATIEQSDNRKPEAKIDSAQGYGYQIHLCRQGCFRGDGAFGQLCFVAPKENLVIAATSSFESMEPLQTLLNLIYKYIIGRLGKVVSDYVDKNELQKKLASMVHSVPLFHPISFEIPHVNNSFIMDENPLNIEKLTFSFKEQQFELELQYANEKRESHLSFDFTRPVYFRDLFTKDLADHEQEVVGYAFWMELNTLQLMMYYIETPYKVTYIVTFNDTEIELKFNQNVSFGITEFTTRGSLLKVNI
jgi:hypothetical protein